MSQRLFITGTDTNVGKTIASAILATRALQLGSSVSYHKPIQTGAEVDSDAETVKALAPISETLEVSTGLSLNRPLSPHLSAFYAQSYLELPPIIATSNAASRHDLNLVEGAGGLQVPINRRFVMLDLIHKLAIPCIVVTYAKLGCINHTLLSLEALRARKIPIFGVIMMGKRLRDNEDAIKYYGRIDEVLSLPLVPSLTREGVSEFVLNHHRNIDQFLIGKR